MAKKPLDAEERNSMSEGTFAFPRLRKEPLNDARHVRNAIARFDQVQDVSDKERDEAFRRIKKAAAKYGVDVSEKSWRELGKPSTAKKSTGSASAKKSPTKAELLAEARKRNIAGRSTMTKPQLERTLKSH